MKHAPEQLRIVILSVGRGDVRRLETQDGLLRLFIEGGAVIIRREVFLDNQRVLNELHCWSLYLAG